MSIYSTRALFQKYYGYEVQINMKGIDFERKATFRYILCTQIHV